MSKKKRRQHTVEISGEKEITVEKVVYFYPASHRDSTKRNKRTSFSSKKKLVAVVEFSKMYRDDETGKLKKKRFLSKKTYRFKAAYRKKEITRAKINKMVQTRLNKKRKPVESKIIDGIMSFHS
jgi:hypothetical protein